jgi:hypothetical protein
MTLIPACFSLPRETLVGQFHRWLAASEMASADAVIAPHDAYPGRTLLRTGPLDLLAVMDASRALA